MDSMARENEIDAFNEREKIWTTVFTLIICVVGLIANCFVIFIILVLKEYKKAVTHWYVLQLAIADTLFLLTLPFKASQKINGSWIYSVGLCKTQESLLYINYYASILFLTIMSVDRYVAVCHTLSNALQNMRKPAVSYIVTIVIWAIAILIAIPIMLYSDVIGTRPNCKCRGEFPQNEETLDECLQNVNQSDPFFVEFCMNITDPDRERCIDA